MQFMRKIIIKIMLAKKNFASGSQHNTYNMMLYLYREC